MNRKVKLCLGIIVVVLVVLALALWVIPYVQLSADANSEQIRSEASQLISAYQESNPEKETPAQKDVCRDLVWLGKLNMSVAEISSVDDDAVVYVMDSASTSEATTYVDVTKDWSGTLYYHTTDNLNGDATIRVRPWGSTKIF